MFSQPTRKRFGQHWLTSEKVLSKIVAAAAVTDQDIVLEIGPGTGVLTQSLLPLAQAVVAVEIDRDLHQRLSQKFAQKPNLHLIQADFLALDPTALELPTPPTLDDVRSRPNKVVANIPYYITGPILEKLLGTIAHPNPQPYDSIVLLVQKEVAERLYAKPGSRAFGALSVRVQYLADCELVCPVPAKAFQPPPKVDSAVVKLTPRALPVAAESPDYLDQLVRLGFASKRKMLRNNLKATVDRDQLLAVMTDLAIPETARAEDLGVPQWVALSNRLGSA
ncbi:16S rRNA (adenine(1518)-N(6)/adenine(1519)-N(6))-dimethyltransferase [Leptolyngbya sp. BL0902]|uniref:16S rRNA (adenine(1518)-N(6)/adenine(1519)-N(6))- dimethyltransferase RsmA n=1 Tax=Leptolyngbya sp. BL0902 TaxID=1115757 RepID=UPI0018E73B35|nr:16S rRNA (adenine(1518)-N(6)/adenine(1519)-N(6))-dimethyltransferase RsmA [Leptolyngbya sp. BL0902]QQE66667.1 16S rRNA (adenine(1518)-N(6)/adenine(1519)-N(6))-dimethyltransferase [Leptolyngbya sp. BL0902]